MFSERWVLFVFMLLLNCAVLATSSWIAWVYIEMYLPASVKNVSPLSQLYDIFFSILSGLRSNSLLRVSHSAYDFLWIFLQYKIIIFRNFSKTSCKEENSLSECLKTVSKRMQIIFLFYYRFVVKRSGHYPSMKWVETNFVYCFLQSKGVRVFLGKHHKNLLY